MKASNIKIAYLFVLLFCVLTGLFASNQPSPANYSEHVLSVDMVVNDVLYAGFSTRKIDSFQPIEDDIDAGLNIGKFIEREDKIVSQTFYVYGIVSSDDPVKISVDFAGRSKKDGSNKGVLYSVGNVNTIEIPVTLLGTDITHPPHIKDAEGKDTTDTVYPPNQLPLVLTINPGAGSNNSDNNTPAPTSRATNGTTEPSAVNTNYVCSDMLWLEMKKADIIQAEKNAKSSLSGTYRAELMLTIIATK